MADKQAALAQCIAQATAKELAAEFTFLGEKLGVVELQNKSILARLEMLEEAKPADGAKRAIRTTGGAKKAPNSKVAASPDSKVSNALLYFRRAMQEGWHDYRDTYATPENLEAADADLTVAKKDKNKDEGEYFSAVGNYLWKFFLTDENKAEVRDHFKTWKEAMLHGETDTQLDEEAQ